MEKISIKKECFIKTNDWWCGNSLKDGQLSDNYDIDTDDISTWDGREYIRLSLSIYTPMKLVRVCVWGNDDFGMAKDFEVNEYEKAIELYDSLSNYILLNRDILEEMGFENA